MFYSFWKATEVAVTSLVTEGSFGVGNRSNDIYPDEICEEVPVPN